MPRDSPQARRPDRLGDQREQGPQARVRRRRRADTGADTLVTHGGFQSNHCRATAAIGARLGLKVRLILRSAEPDPPRDGNLFLDHLFGADITLHPPEEYNGRRKELIDAAMDAERAAGGSRTSSRSARRSRSGAGATSAASRRWPSSSAARRRSTSSAPSAPPARTRGSCSARRCSAWTTGAWSACRSATASSISEATPRPRRPHHRTTTASASDRGADADRADRRLHRRGLRDPLPGAVGRRRGCSRAGRRPARPDLHRQRHDRACSRQFAMEALRAGTAVFVAHRRSVRTHGTEGSILNSVQRPLVAPNRAGCLPLD